MNKRAFSAGEKKLLVFSVLVIAVPLVIGVFFNRINATPVVSIPPYPQAPQPNGYDLYVAAALAMTVAKPAVDSVNDSNVVTDPTARARQYSLARKNVWLAQNKAAFALFERAQQTPILAPSERPPGGTAFSSYSKLRQLARAKRIESNARWMRGDYAGVLESELDTVQMGHDMRRGGVLITSLVGIAIGSIGRAASHDTVEKIEATPARKAARRLEKLLETRWSLAQTYTEEKHYVQTAWLELFKTDDWRSPNTLKGADFEEEEDGPISMADRFRLYTISKQHIMDNVAATADHEIANARLPYTKQGAPMIITDDPFLQMYQLPNGRFSDAHDLAGDQSLMLRLALRAYFLENSDYPSDLKALTPNYLEAIPADPFGGGQNWRYRLDGTSYKLWSIGPDGKDDGGTLVPWTKKPVTYPDERARLPFVNPDSKGDYVAGKNG